MRAKLIVLALVASLPAQAQYKESKIAKAAQGSFRGQLAPHEVLVKFRSRPSSLKMSQLGIQTLSQLGGSGFVHARLSPGESVAQAVARLQVDPNVESVQPNFIYRTLARPNDSLYSQLWAARNTGQTVTSNPLFSDAPRSSGNPGTAGRDLGLEGAWDYITDCSSVTVAVVDTGVNYNHSDLSASLWNGGTDFPKHGYDFVNNDNDPMDLNGHGTHVAGTIGATGNNGQGSTGICWKNSIMAVRVMDATGAGNTVNIIKGVLFAADHGARVINMSLGGPDQDQAFQDAIDYAGSKGAVVVVAAGNDGNDNDDTKTPEFPCNYGNANLICVAALDQNYNLASFSNRGAHTVHVAAPGVNIVSLWPGTTTTTTETFHNGATATWTTSNANWKYATRTFKTSTGDLTLDMMINPNNWDGNTKTYGNNANDRTYMSYNLSGADAAVADFLAFIDTEENHDFVNIAMKKGGGDPFTGGTALDSLSGASGDSATELSYDLTPCIDANCSFGFQLSSDSSVVATGVGILELTISTLKLDGTHYNVIAGTSMAAPHVAGIVSMVMAFNPGYSVQDTVRAVKEGGVALDVLNGKTTTGKAASALGSVSYIAAPVGVTVK